VFFWYLLVTVVPFLVVSWRTPNTYPTGGVRRGTATQIPRDPGQPQGRRCVGHSRPRTDWFGSPCPPLPRRLLDSAST